MAENLIKLKVNKKLLQQKPSMDSGKVVTLKDISNLVTEWTLQRNVMIYKTQSRTCKTIMVSSKKSAFANFSKLRNCSKRHAIPQITQVRP